MKRLVLFLAATLSAGPAYAQMGSDLTTSLPGLEKAPPFTADVTIVGSTPTPTSYHISFMPNRVRMETGGAMPQTIITRVDQGMVYISQGDNSWMKMSLASVGGGGLTTFNHTIHKVGSAMLDGRMCDVYESKSADGTSSSTNYLYHEAPVRSIVHGPTGTMTVTYQNLHLGDVSASLFELPANAQVTSMESILDQAKGLMDKGNGGIGE